MIKQIWRGVKAFENKMVRAHPVYIARCLRAQRIARRAERMAALIGELSRDSGAMRFLSPLREICAKHNCTVAEALEAVPFLSTEAETRRAATENTEEA